MMEPAVALPILLSLVALLGISLLDEPKRVVVRRIDPDEPDVDPIADLDAMLASVGIDVNDLDATLASLGIDVDDLPAITPVREPDRLEQSTDEPRAPVMSG